VGGNKGYEFVTWSKSNACVNDEFLVVSDFDGVLGVAVCFLHLAGVHGRAGWGMGIALPRMCSALTLTRDRK
jgi:hypothetical protein